MGLSFATKDKYGNFIDNELICSYYSHPRYLLYFNFLTDPIPSTTSLTLTESFDSLLYLKYFTLQLTHDPLVFNNLYLNYTLLDGLFF